MVLEKAASLDITKEGEKAMRQIILASQSPRRKALLEQVGLLFKVHAAQIEETLDVTCSIPQAIEKLAYDKAKAVAEMFPEDIVIGADTVVCLQNQILGKPHSDQEAKAMLKQLSGKTHQVITGVSILSKSEEDRFHVISDVTFYDISDDEIDAYVASGEPMDKAGAYGIQGKGAIFVAKIVGDYYNIVGLPVAEVMQRLKAYR